MRIPVVLLVAAAGVMAAAAASYETRTVECRQFQVGREGALEVWFLPTRAGEEISAFLLLSNESDEAVRFFPQRARVEAVRAGRKGEKRSTLRTYHPAQYQSLVLRRRWTKGGLRAEPPPRMGKGPAGGPDDRRPDAGQPSIVESECGSGNQQACSWLIAKGHRIEIPSTLQRILGSWGEVRFDRAIESLLWPHELSAHHASAGQVYIKFEPGDSYRIRVPVGDVSFDFDFTFPENAGRL